MRRGVTATSALAAVLVAACGPAPGVPPETPIDRAVDVSGRDIRDTEYCAQHSAECGGDNPARVLFKAARLFNCPEQSLRVTYRAELHDTTLGHTHGRDFQSWWPEGQILRTRDPQDPGEVFEAQGCGRQGRFTCFHAHVIVKGDGSQYDDPQATDCVREAPWDPTP
jgi:hypothetical protein